MTAPATTAKPRPPMSTVVCPTLGGARRVRTTLHTISTHITKGGTAELSDTIWREGEPRLQVA
jgi:hypothetical protein